MKEKYALIIDDEIEEIFEATLDEAVKKYDDEVELNKEDTLHWEIELVKLERINYYELKVEGVSNEY